MNKKWCPACEKEIPCSDFHRNRRRSDGLDWRCKFCKKESINRTKRRAREKRYYEENISGRADKLAARKNANNHWKDFVGSNVRCMVLGCQSPSEELAHLDYKYPLDVLSLCKWHHRMMDNNRPE